MKKNEHIAELEIGNSLIGIHSGGEGKKTWTGISFQVPDVVEGAKELIASGGNLSREPEPEDDAMEYYENHGHTLENPETHHHHQRRAQHGTTSGA